VFKAMRDGGAIAADARFSSRDPGCRICRQSSFFADPTEWTTVRDAHQDAVGREIGRILEVIPADDPLIQFDIANEIRDLYTGDETITAHAPRRSLDQKWRGIWPTSSHSRPLFQRTWLSATTSALELKRPATYSGRKDLGVCVTVANEIVTRSPRPVDYIHMPVLPEADATFFPPLSDLSIGNTRLISALSFHDAQEERS
jgi:hypothetical protein